MASLTFEQSGQIFHVALNDSAITIGRDPLKVDLVLRDDAVSRTHARVFRLSDTWQLQDLGSTGGTCVNRVRVVPEKPVLLDHGDTIRIGPYKLRFQNEDQYSVGRAERFTGLKIDDDDQSSIQRSVRSSGYGLVSVCPQDKLNGILKINEALAGNVDLHAICPRVLETLFEIFPQADRGAILLLHGQENELQPVTHRHRHAEDSTPVRISRTILNNVLRECSAILSANTPFDPRVANSESLLAQTIQSTMCVPMLGLDGKPIGIISLDSQDRRKQFRDDDLQLLVAVASQASHVFENARLLTVYMEKLKQDHELKVSAQVQRSLIPESMPEVPGYRIYGSYDAAKTVGGDYYDSFLMPGGKICVSFGDVSGKGFPAALIMARLSGIVRITMNFTDDVGLAMCQINSLMCNNMAEGRFVTYVLGVIDPVQHTFTFGNAGHMPPELCSQDGTLSNPGIERSGPPIGLSPDYQYETLSLPLPVGTIVVLRTDGVDEAMNPAGQQLGEARFRDCLRASQRDPESICRSLFAAVKSFADSEPQQDDITIMSFGRTE